MSEAIEAKVEEAKEAAKAENEKPDFVEVEREGKKTETKPVERKDEEKPKGKAKKDDKAIALPKGRKQREFSPDERVIVMSDRLLKVAKVCASVAAQKSVTPIFQYMQIQMHDGTVTCKAANGETSISSSIQCLNELQEDATEYIPCRKVAQIAAAIPAGDVILKPGNAELTILAGKSKFRLNGSVDLWSDDEFGVFDVTDGQVFGTVKADVLLDAINHVKDCMSDDETRRQLNGIVFSYRGGESVTVAATDGRCLGMTEMPVKLGEPQEDFDMIMSSASIAQLVSILGEQGNADVTMTRSRSMVKFACGELVFTSKLVEGNYPNFRQVLPDYRGNNYEKLNVKTAAVKNVLAAGALLGDEMTWRVSRDNGVASVKGEEGEDMTTSIEIDGYHAEDEAKVTFSILFFKRPVKVLKNEDMTLYICPKGYNPVIVTEGEYTFMLMPMKGQN